jgi:hypothetical protein
VRGMRKRYDKEFKAKVAIEALRGERMGRNDLWRRSWNPRADSNVGRNPNYELFSALMSRTKENGFGKTNDDLAVGWVDCACCWVPDI